MLQVCLDDDACRVQWLALEEPVLAELQDGSMVAYMDAISELTEEGQLGDPRTSCSKKQVRWEREAIRSYLVDGTVDSASGKEEYGCSVSGHRRLGWLWLLAGLGLWGRRRN